MSKLTEEVLEKIANHEKNIANTKVFISRLLDTERAVRALDEAQKAKSALKMPQIVIKVAVPDKELAEPCNIDEPDEALVVALHGVFNDYKNRLENMLRQTGISSDN